LLSFMRPQHDVLGQHQDDFARAIKTLAFNVSLTQTKVQNLKTGNYATVITVQGQQIEEVDHFCYLDSTTLLRRTSSAG